MTLKSRLEKVARRRRVPSSAIVRRAIEKELNGGQRGARLANFRAVKKLSGSLSGPSDLATNPKYLEGLGA
jgi:hypothetical protein